MDGLLINTEDLYTLCINLILEKYGRPEMPWSIKAKLQGRPALEATQIFCDWAQLPIDGDQYQQEVHTLQEQVFPTAEPLPGVAKLLGDLGRTRFWDSDAGQAAAAGREGGRPGRRVHVALASSSHHSKYRLKTTHLADLFSVFESHRLVLGDDKRIPPGRGKPLPDIYLLALQTINESLSEGEEPISPEECLVFEDSVPGVEAGRRAGMRVIWCPHPLLKEEYAGREKTVLAGRMGEAGDVDLHQVGEIDDGWAEYLESLVEFPYAQYGIVVPPVEVEGDPSMKESANLDGGVQVVKAV